MRKSSISYDFGVVGKALNISGNLNLSTVENENPKNSLDSVASAYYFWEIKW